MMKIDFAKLELDHQSNNGLFDFCKKHRLGLAAREDHENLSPEHFKFHITVTYSKKTSERFIPGIFTIPHHVVEPLGFQAFGPEQDILALALKLDPILSGLSDHYKRTFGHVSDFTPFRPHITIKGDASGVWDRLDTLPLPDFTLKVTRLVHLVKEG